MKTIISILFLLIFYSNIVIAQHYKQIDIERECLNCGAFGITLQMRWGEHQGKLYDTIKLAYFRNQKISMTKFRKCADEIAQVMGFRYDGTLAEQIAHVINLTELYIGDKNEILIPNNIHFFKNLRCLWFENVVLISSNNEYNINNLNSLSNLNKLPSLYKLMIINGGLCEQSLDFLKEMKKLEWLDLSKNCIFEIPSVLTNIKRLGYLNVSQNCLKNTLDLRKLKKIMFLEVKDNPSLKEILLTRNGYIDEAEHWIKKDKSTKVIWY